MKSMRILSLSLLVGLAGGSAAGQEVENLVRVDSGNRSATAAVTRSIAAYIAARNSATAVQVMSQPRPDAAPAMSVQALLTAIESNARIVAPPPAPAPEPTPAAVTPAPAPQPVTPQNVTPVAKKGSRGGGGSGASGGGGGGW